MNFFKQKQTSMNVTMLMIIGSLLLGTNSVVIQQGLDDLHPLLYVGIRYVFIGLLMAPLATKKARSMTPHAFGQLMINALLITVVAATWAYALKNTTALTITFMGLLVPLFVYIGSLIFLHEPYHRRALGGSILGLVGGLLVALSPYLVDAPADDSTGSALGNILAFVMSISIAALILQTKRLYNVLGVFQALSLRYFISGVLLLGIGFGIGGRLDPAEISTNSWLSLVVATVVGGFIAQSLFYSALAKMRAEDSAPLFYFEPLSGFALAVIFLGDRFNSLAAIGATIIIAGVLLSHPVHTKLLHFYHTPHHSKWDDFKRWLKHELHVAEQQLDRIIHPNHR